MKKTLSVLTALSLSATMLAVPLYAANGILEEQKIEEQADVEQEELFRFVAQEGVIQEIRESFGKLSVLITNEETGLDTVIIVEDALLLDLGTTEVVKASDLKEGLTITAYYRDDIALAMIYPVVIPANLILIGNPLDEMVTAKVSRFNENLVSVDNDLKLNLEPDTPVFNQHGEAVSSSKISEHNVLVLYTIATKSIPAQTTPKKVIVFEIEDQNQSDQGAADLAELRRLLQVEAYQRGTIDMVPLRVMAEFLGYEVSWNNTKKSVELNREEQTFMIQIGKEEYSFNDAHLTFEVAPELFKNKTFVPISLLDLLID